MVEVFECTGGLGQGFYTVVEPGTVPPRYLSLHGCYIGSPAQPAFSVWKSTFINVDEVSLPVVDMIAMILVAAMALAACLGFISGQQR